jgi:vanillate O-demethylase monooxygenase subunit
MMMAWLKNRWYAASWSTEISPRKPLVRTFLDEPVLLWRGDESHIHAIVDRCPHRLAPLSLGSVDGNNVRCGYHGIAFDGSTGQCVDNPHGPMSAALHVRTYPTIEKHGIVWIWLGDPKAASPAIVPDLSFIDSQPVHAFSKGYTHAGADHRLLEDNILDLSHSDYLHPATLGGGSFTRARATVEERGDSVFVRWEAKNEHAIPIWQSELPDPDMPVDMVTEVSWHPGGVMTLSTWTAPAAIQSDLEIITRNAHLVTPETPRSSHYFYCNSRNYRVDDEDYNSAISAGLDYAFRHEDKPMLEAQQLRVGDADLLDCSPALMRIDNASTRARRIYRRLVDAEQKADFAP